VGDPARYKASHAELFISWDKRCERSGEPPGHRKALFEKLENRGFARFSSHGNRGFAGLAIRQEHICPALTGTDEIEVRVHLGAAVPD
jgi:hypothetical protein